MVIHALLAALIAVVSFLPLKTLGLEITFSMVPVAVGACLLGKKSGAFLGGVFGTVSFLQCLGYSAFGSMLLQENWFATFLVCVPTRILAGFLAGVIADLLRKSKQDLAFLAGSVIAPVLNTAFFMGVLCLFFYNMPDIITMRDQLGANSVLMFILLFVGVNGLVEIIAGFLLAFPITKAVSVATKPR